MKKVKFPLEMQNGQSARTIEELREYFDYQKIIQHFLSGKLAIWLNDRYYDSEYEKVQELTADTPNLGERLCEILQVDYNGEKEINIETVISNNEKLTKLKQYTTSEEILQNISVVAMSQEELISILNSGEKTVYLCGTDFELPLDYNNVLYIGVNNPTISINSSAPELFYKNGIKTDNLTLPNEVLKHAHNDPDYVKAEALFIKHDLEKAMPLIFDLCERQNPRAYLLTYYYYLDQIDNSIDCFKYVRKGYEQGEPLCSYIYALNSEEVAEEERMNVFKKHKPAIKALATFGDVLANYIMGISYINVTNEEQDYALAIHYFEACIASGFYRAYFSLAKRYVFGQGVEQNYEKANELYEKSAAMGHSWSLYELACNNHWGYGCEKNINKAVELYKKAALCFNPCRGAKYELGRTYYYGWGEEKQDYTESIRWFEKAAKMGEINSMNFLGCCYKDGEGTPKNIELAIEYFEKASAGGDQYGAYNLGCLYFEGKDVDKDYKKAKQYLLLAAERGHTGCQEYLDIIDGNPAMIEKVIEKLEAIKTISFSYESLPSFFNAKTGWNYKFNSRSEAQRNIESQYNGFVQEIISKHFTPNNDNIMEYIRKCQNKLNECFTELNSAFVSLSVDTSGLTNQCEEYKAAISSGIKALMNDSYYRTYDISKDVANFSIEYNDMVGLFDRYYYIEGFDGTNDVAKQAQTKWDRLKKDSENLIDQILQPLIMELKTKCAEIKNSNRG